jgi:archaellum biogenesis ATPase FlaH
MNDFIYAEFVEGGIHNRNKIYKVKDFKLNGIITDCYRSMFLYNEDLKFYVDKTGSVKGYTGKHVSDSIVFDFDGEDLQAVKDEAVKFCLHLYHTYEVHLDFLRISFSGNKGFHICIPMRAVCEPIPKENFYEIIKNISKDISEGFKFVDYSIYESKRLLRLLNTKHSKSGLYKIPLLYDELDSFTIGEIKEFAKDKRNIETLPASEMTIIKPLNELYTKWNDYKPLEHREDLQNKHDEILNLFDGVDESGRHKALIRITAMLEKKGLSYDLILEILRNWNLKNRPPLPDDRLENESRRCFDDNRKNISSVKIYSLQDAEAVYKDYIKKIDSCKAKTGYSSIDKKIRGIMPGETLCILGKTSVGKSALLQNIGMNFAKESKEPVLFFSMEMPITSVYERACQIESGLTGYEIENEYKRNSNLIFTTLKNFYTIEQSGLNLEQIKNLIRFAEKNIYHRKTGLVLIDYLGLVKGNGKDIYEQVSRVARSSKDTAKELNIPIIFLSQVNRNYKEYDELEINAARDSGAIDEASDFILGIWKEKDNRPETEQTDIKLKLGILKNRKGGLGRISITMDKKSLKILEV